MEFDIIKSWQIALKVKIIKFKLEIHSEITSSQFKDQKNIENQWKISNTTSFSSLWWLVTVQ